MSAGINLHHHLLFNVVSKLYTQLPNMSQKSAAHEAMIEHYMKMLLRAPTLTVPKLMILALFLQKDMADDSLRQMITQCLPSGTKGSIEWDSSRTRSTLSLLTADNELAASAGVPMS
jgi:hypothetical protein